MGDIALVVLLIGAGLIAAEMVLRVAYRLRRASYVWTPHARLRLEIDRTVLPQLDPVARLSFNRHGERGPPPPRRWHDTMRILVAGDSVAECHFLDQQRTWPQVVQRILGTDGGLRRLDVNRVHVGSIARSLVSTEAVCAMLGEVLHRYPRLDVLLLMVGGSDVVSWLEAGTPSELADGKVDASEVLALHRLGPWGWTPRRLACKRLLAALHERVRPTKVRKGVGKQLARLRRMRGDAREIISEIPDETPMVDRFERWFRRVVALSTAHADRVMAVRYAWIDRPIAADEQWRLWNFARGRPHFEHVDTYYDHRVATRLLQAVDRRAVSVSAELGIQTIDLRSSLEPTWDNFYDLNHLTPRGAERAGRAVADAILGALTRPSDGPMQRRLTQ